MDPLILVHHELRRQRRLLGEPQRALRQPRLSHLGLALQHGPLIVEQGELVLTERLRLLCVVCPRDDPGFDVRLRLALALLLVLDHRRHDLPLPTQGTEVRAPRRDLARCDLGSPLNRLVQFCLQRHELTDAFVVGFDLRVVALDRAGDARSFDQELIQLELVRDDDVAVGRKDGRRHERIVTRQVRGTSCIRDRRDHDAQHGERERPRRQHPPNRRQAMEPRAVGLGVVRWLCDQSDRTGSHRTELGAIRQQAVRANVAGKSSIRQAVVL